MNGGPSVLCPIDFSDSSAGALRYGAVIAGHFGTRLMVLAVEDPLLTEAADLGTGVLWSAEDCTAEMEKFASRALGVRLGDSCAELDYVVAVGKPATEILRVARERAAGLIVMSTHGLTGVRKLFFGSTTERVLRETPCPVLLTSGPTPAHIRLPDLKAIVGRILVPVDLSAASLPQAQVGRALAETLGLPLILVHVVEPLRTRLAARLHLVGIEADRRAVAEDGLNELADSLAYTPRPEALVAYGEPAEELAKVARDRHAGLIVMGLHGSPLLGPRMGSVTYRLLCLSSALVLALPPAGCDGKCIRSRGRAGAGLDRTTSMTPVHPTAAGADRFQRRIRSREPVCRRAREGAWCIRSLLHVLEESFATHEVWDVRRPRRQRPARAGRTRIRSEARPRSPPGLHRPAQPSRSRCAAGAPRAKSLRLLNAGGPTSSSWARTGAPDCMHLLTAVSPNTSSAKPACPVLAVCESGASYIPETTDLMSAHAV